jgi:hypothetical protein
LAGGTALATDVAYAAGDMHMATCEGNAVQVYVNTGDACGWALAANLQVLWRLSAAGSKPGIWTRVLDLD